MSDKKRIAKNTLFLYFRMILIMGVTLYMSRVILDKLGVDDYGLYQVVGGVVGFLTFLNGTLSLGTSRFLTYELGSGDESKLKRTFSTAFYTHVALAIVVIIIMETGGLWFLCNKLVIPAERFNACMCVFQFSLLTTLVSILQVPNTAIIMAHERMEVYAYISIFEAFAKLGVCYLITITVFDRLIFYAFLILIVQFLVAILYGVYCIKHYEESRSFKIFDKGIFRSLVGFSGWNVMANMTSTLKLQGVVILLNMFFTPAIVAAQAIANQVTAAMLQFVNNFRSAINPQIIKLYAAGDTEESKRLTLETTVYCFDLTLILALPTIVMMDYIMSIWLVEVPPYAVIFTQWILGRAVIETFGASFYIPMMAANKIKANSIAALVLSVGYMLSLYIVFKLGYGPLWVQYLGLVLSLSFGLLVKPFVLYKQIDYSIKELLHCYWQCFKVLLVSLVLTAPTLFLFEDGLPQAVIKGLISVLAVGIASYLFMNASTKLRLKQFVTEKFYNINNK